MPAEPFVEVEVGEEDGEAGEENEGAADEEVAFDMLGDVLGVMAGRVRIVDVRGGSGIRQMGMQLGHGF